MSAVGEEGRVLPGLLLVVVGLLAGGVLLFRIGWATVLKAEAVTAADFAALAGADGLRGQLVAHVLRTGVDTPLVPDCERVEHAAADAAARNGGELLRVTCEGLSVQAEVTNDAQHRLGGLGAHTAARAEVGATYAAGLPSLVGASIASGGDCPLSEAELAQTADHAGRHGPGGLRAAALPRLRGRGWGVRRGAGARDASVDPRSCAWSGQ
ncbi:MAG: hypothetical protein ACRD0K_01945 [Egibacteraceae bacterium]